MNNRGELKQKKIEVLKLARKRLVNHNNTCICYALQEACTGKPELRKARNKLRTYIMHGLGGYAWLNTWLDANRPKLSQCATNMRAYRIQWIDWMIASLEGKN